MLVAYKIHESKSLPSVQWLPGPQNNKTSPAIHSEAYSTLTRLFLKRNCPRMLAKPPHADFRAFRMSESGSGAFPGCAAAAASGREDDYGFLEYHSCRKGKPSANARVRAAATHASALEVLQRDGYADKLSPSAASPAASLAAAATTTARISVTEIPYHGHAFKNHSSVTASTKEEREGDCKPTDAPLHRSLRDAAGADKRASTNLNPPSPFPPSGKHGLGQRASVAPPPPPSDPADRSPRSAYGGCWKKPSSPPSSLGREPSDCRSAEKPRSSNEVTHSKNPEGSADKFRPDHRAAPFTHLRNAADRSSCSSSSRDSFLKRWRSLNVLDARADPSAFRSGSARKEQRSSEGGSRVADSNETKKNSKAFYLLEDFLLPRDGVVDRHASSSLRDKARQSIGQANSVSPNGSQSSSEAEERGTHCHRRRAEKSYSLHVPARMEPKMMPNRSFCCSQSANSKSGCSIMTSRNCFQQPFRISKANPLTKKSVTVSKNSSAKKRDFFPPRESSPLPPVNFNNKCISESETVDARETGKDSRVFSWDSYVLGLNSKASYLQRPQQDPDGCTSARSSRKPLRSHKVLLPSAKHGNSSGGSRPQRGGSGLPGDDNGGAANGSKCPDPILSKYASSSRPDSRPAGRSGCSSVKLGSHPAKDVSGGDCPKGGGGSCQTAASKLPLSPAEALKQHGSKLMDYERREILQYPEVWFLGLDTKKINGVENGPQNGGYDDENGSYNKVLGDHISYRYEILEVIGKGSFGQVIRAHDHKNNKQVAIKIIRNKRRFHHQALIEVRILSHLKRKEKNETHSVIQMLDYFYFRNHLCISFELMGMNLYELIKRNNYQGFHVATIREFARSVIHCLRFLRRENVIHCDLKPENILLKEKGNTELKVIDFGSSCFVHQRIYTYIQSRFYRSPEVILGMPYGTSIDMWSLGCILAELCTGCPLFPGENEAEQLASIMEVLGKPDECLLANASRRRIFFDSKGNPRSITNSKGRKRKPGTKALSEVLKCFDAAFLDFVLRCLDWNSETRLTPDEAANHPWLSHQSKSDVSGMPCSSNASPCSKDSAKLLHVKNKRVSLAENTEVLRSPVRPLVRENGGSLPGATSVSAGDLGANAVTTSW